MRNDRRDDDLFDDARLRRALRLEAAELPARIDLAAITARAEASRPAFAAASLVSTAVAGLAGAALVALAGVALPAVAPALASDVFATATDVLARAAVPASVLLAAAQQPSVPLAALAALAVAIAYEYAQRRGRIRVSTS
jgi:hypothetical protein